MQLLLTSAGLSSEEIVATFLNLLVKPLDQVQVVFIPTASRTKPELKYVDESRQELINLGIKSITTLDLNHKIANDEIEDADVLYVCGGNTYYLLQKIHASGFDQVLSGYRGLYFGVSAGSIVAGPNIEVTSDKKNDVNLSDTTGMNIVNFAIIPHCQSKDQTVIQNLKNRVHYEIVELTDNQAVLVANGEKKIIGQP